MKNICNTESSFPREKKELTEVWTCILWWTRHGESLSHLLNTFDVTQLLLLTSSIWRAGERRVTVVRSPKSGVNFFSLGDFEEQLEMACERAQPAIYQVRRACIRPDACLFRGVPEL